MSVEIQDRAAARDSGPFAPPPDFRIEAYLVRPSLNRVVAPSGTFSLEPKVMRVLLCLAARAGEVVTKEELFRDVWQGAYVTEDVLTRAIGELRRLFRDEPGRPRVIETIRKSGYRLILPVLPAGSDEGLAPPVLPTPSSSRAGASARGRLAGAGLAIAAAVALAWLLIAPDRHAAPAPMRIRPLTSLPGNERDPAVSPDGSRVAFAWNGGAGEDMSLYVQLTKGESALRLTRETGVEDRAPAWSPDGQRLAFTRASKSDCRILLVSALGGEERPLAPCGDREYRRLAWSPDGRSIVLSGRDANGALRLELLSPDTLERRPLTHPPSGILGDTSPAFSPDGRDVAFTRNVTDGVDDIYRVPAAGGEPTRLTFDNRDIMGSAWADDGGSIVFSSSRAGIYSLWRVPARGGEPAWVAGGGTKMKHPAAARTSRVLAFENWIYEVNLWSVPARAGAGPVPERRLTAATDEWNFEPHISPDGRRVAFVSTRSGSEEVWVVGLDGTGSRRLTNFGGARLETPRWSPDGNRLVFSARVPTRADLYVVSAEGGVPERLTADTSDAVTPSFSRDGRSVLFASRRGGGSWQVWRLDLEGRRITPVTTEGGYAAQESPDGRSIYFTRPAAAGIWKQGASPGAAVERVTDRLAPEDWANWEAGARGIYFREPSGSAESPAVAFLPYGASAPVRLAPLSEQGWPGLAVSPDGESIVYPRIDRHTCDIRLIENPA